MKVKILFFLIFLNGFVYSQNNSRSLELEQANEEYFELNNPFFEGLWYGTGDHNRFSIMCWVKIKENSIDEQVIFLHQTSSNFDIKLSIYENELSFYLNASGNEYVMTHFIDSVNCWNHIAISSECQSLSNNPSTIRMYINGDYKNQIQILNDINWNSNLISEKIGGEGSFNGYIDDFSVWNISLNESNINSIINNGTSIEENGLIGFWNFDLSVEDLINNNDGQLINGANFSINTTDNLTCGSCFNDTSTTSITACESYEWNGETYTESGTFYHNGILNTSSLDFGNNCSGFGNTFVDYGDVLDMTGSFTIGAWIYNNGCDYTTIMSKRPGNNPYNGFHLSYEPGGNYDFIIHKDWTVWTGSQAIVSTPAISNEWVHMTAVFEAGQYVAIYINGSLMNQVSTNISSLSYANAPFLIGSLQYGGNWSWDGKIDNAFIFDKAFNRG